MVNWLTNWNYRKAITISSSGSVLTDYQVLTTIDTANLITAGKMRPDCGDIRFTDSDGSTLLSYWIESGINSITTKIWVNIPYIPGGTKTIYIYYDNPSATYDNPLGGSNTFEFFDDFLGTSLDPTKWTFSSLQTYTYGTGTINVSNSIATITGGNYTWWGMFANGAAPALPPFTVEFLFKGENEQQAGVEIPGILNPSPKDLAAFSFDVTKYASCNDNICNGEGITPSISSWSLLRIDIYSGGINYYVNRTLVYTKTTNVPDEGMKVYIAAAWPIGKAYTDWVFIRKYASTEPTSSTPGIEEVSTCPSVLKYEGDIIYLSATPKDGTGPYYVEFIKSINGIDTAISYYTGAPENTEITYDYTLTEGDIRNALSGTIDFSVFISDSCPTGPKTCTGTCTITIGCLAPVCNFTAT